MESSPTKAILELFTKYEACAQQLDYRGVARLYGSRMIAAGPRGIQFHRNNMLTRWQFDKGMKAFYTQAGLNSMRIIAMKETPISDQFSLVKVNWAATFRKNPDQPIEFHISYLVSLSKRRPKIVLFISHEDETKILQGYGIIP